MYLLHAVHFAKRGLMNSKTTSSRRREVAQPNYFSNFLNAVPSWPETSNRDIRCDSEVSESFRSAPRQVFADQVVSAKRTDAAQLGAPEIMFMAMNA